MKFEFDASEIDSFMDENADVIGKSVDKVAEENISNLYEQPLMAGKEDMPSEQPWVSEQGKLSLARHAWGPLFVSSVIPQHAVNTLRNDVQHDSTKQEYIIGRIKNNYILNPGAVKKYNTLLQNYIYSYLKLLLDMKKVNFQEDKFPLVANIKHMVASTQKKKEYVPRRYLSGDLSFIIFLDGRDENEENPLPGGELPGILTFYDNVPDVQRNIIPEKEHISALFSPIRSTVVKPAAGEIYIFPSSLEHGIECFFSKEPCTFITGVVDVSFSENVKVINNES